MVTLYQCTKYPFMNEDFIAKPVQCMHKTVYREYKGRARNYVSWWYSLELYYIHVLHGFGE